MQNMIDAATCLDRARLLSMMLVFMCFIASLLTALPNRSACRFLFTGIIITMVSACRPGDTTWDSYEETFIRAGHDHGHTEKPQTDRRATVPTGRAEISWTTPEGWTEESGTGMRMGSFSIERDGETASCTIIRLSGAAGGLEANIQRWIRQLGLPPLSSDEMSGFIARQSTIESIGGHVVLVADLGELLTDKNDDTPSVITGVIELGTSTLFIKLNGSTSLLNAEHDAFMELCRSIQTGGGH